VGVLFSRIGEHMKEWCMAHPILTFIIIACLIDAIVTVIKYFTGYKDRED